MTTEDFMANGDGFSCEVVKSARKLSVTEEIQAEDVSTCERLDSLVGTDGTALMIEVTNFVALKIHNPKSRRNTDYKTYLLCTETGAYCTGSRTLAESVWNVFEKLGKRGVNLDKVAVTLSIRKYPTANYPGNYFMKASLVAYVEG